MSSCKNSLTKIIVINILVWITLTGCGRSSGSKAVEPSPAPDVTSATQCGQYQLSSDQTCTTIGERSAITYAPVNQTEYSGLAIFLHGAPGEPTKVSKLFGAKVMADQFNFVSVAPQGNGSNYEWNSSNNNDAETPDVDYLASIIDHMQAQYSFTENNVYIFGYSAGGFMAYKLACKIPERLTAVVSLAGQFRGDFDECSTSTPLAIHHLHSATDRAVPFNGRVNGNIASVSDTVEFWQLKNGCSAVKEEEIQGGVTATSSQTRTEKYTGCISSVALSHLDSVDHEDNYLAESLLATYEYLLKD